MTRVELLVRDAAGWRRWLRANHMFSKFGLEPDAREHRRVLAVLTWLNESP